MRKILCLSCIAVFLLTGLTSIMVDSQAAATQDFSFQLHVNGNQLFDGTGKAVRLMGINMPYLSWSANGDGKIPAAVADALENWDINAVRLAVLPKFWLNESTAASYKALIDYVVSAVSAAGKYVLLDNHSYYIAGSDSVSFWRDAALRYLNNPFVIFDLFNEPTCSWRQYFEGGTMNFTDASGNFVSITSAGFPALFREIRATGAKNICIFPGIDWSFDLSKFSEKDFRNFALSVAVETGAADKEAFVISYYQSYFLKETTGNGIMFSSHPYPNKSADWDSFLLNTILEYPVLFGEMGPMSVQNGYTTSLSTADKTYLDTATKYIEKYGLSVTPWSVGAWPFLNKEPSFALSAFGQYIWDFFKKAKAQKAVTLYSNINFKGSSVTLDPGIYTAAELAYKGFPLSSLLSVSKKKDAYEYAVTVYENPDGSGKSTSFAAARVNLLKDFNFKPQRILISRSYQGNLLSENGVISAGVCVSRSSLLSGSANFAYNTSGFDNAKAKAMTDGSLTTHVDVNYWNDWAFGVLYDLGAAKDIGSFSIYSGLDGYPDSDYAIYASGSLGTASGGLYRWGVSTLVYKWSGVNAIHKEYTMSEKLSARYVLIIVTKTGSQSRPKEFQAFQYNAADHFTPRCNLISEGNTLRDGTKITGVRLNDTQTAFSYNSYLETAATLSSLADGVTDTGHIDIPAWSPPLGLLVDLGTVYDVSEIWVYAGYSTYPEGVSIWGADSTSALLTDSSLLYRDYAADTPFTAKKGLTLAKSRAIRYLLIVSTTVTGNARWKEFEVTGQSALLPEYCTGDFNSDGYLDVLDLIEEKRILLGKSSCSDKPIAITDINDDGRFDLLDLLGCKDRLL